jgi:hypothetical protein
MVHISLEQPRRSEFSSSCGRAWLCKIWRISASSITFVSPPLLLHAHYVPTTGGLIRTLYNLFCAAHSAIHRSLVAGSTLGLGMTNIGIISSSCAYSPCASAPGRATILGPYSGQKFGGMCGAWRCHCAENAARVSADMCSTWWMRKRRVNAASGSW